MSHLLGLQPSPLFHPKREICPSHGRLLRPSLPRRRRACGEVSWRVAILSQSPIFNAASRTIPRSPCPQSGWRNVTQAPDSVRLRGLFLFRPPLPHPWDFLTQGRPVQPLALTSQPLGSAILPHAGTIRAWKIALLARPWASVSERDLRSPGIGAGGDVVKYHPA